MPDIPESVDNLLYFTNRKLPDGTRLFAWVEKVDCPACGKGLMGKPIKSDGKVKMRASTYECPECGHEEKKTVHEEARTLEVRYSNPEGKEWKSSSTPYKRKTWKGVKAFVFTNEFTGEKLGITKKMKMPKAKNKGKSFDPDED